MYSIPQLIIAMGGTFLAVFLTKVAAFIWYQVTTVKHQMRGPKSKSWIYGCYDSFASADEAEVDEKWIEQYGPTFKYHAFLNVTRLFTLDPHALAHILQRDAIYEKPEPVRWTLERTLGKGVLFVEGEQHKVQRRIMNPAFGPVQVRELTEIFMEKACQLRDVWLAEITKNALPTLTPVDAATTQDGTPRNPHRADSLPPPTARIEVMGYLSRATLDMIGKAGFNYEFNALHPISKDGKCEDNELSGAFARLYKDAGSNKVLELLQSWFPVLRAIPTSQGRAIVEARSIMSRIGRKLLDDARAAAAAGDTGDGGRDLLSLLVKANTDPALPADQRMADSDVLAQVPTFLVAGHETTRTATTWALFALTQSPDVQFLLRDELLAADLGESPSMDDLNGLPYLDRVVREVLRLHSPIPRTVRVAKSTDEIPCATAWVDEKGVERRTIRVTKGDWIAIPIRALNRSKAVWGEDALEFKPERWEKVPEGAMHVPGIWGHQLSFLAGPRACIGYRFSLVEIKALLYTLVRAFEFELAVAPEDVVSRSTTVQRPYVRTEMEKGMQLPLIVRGVVQQDS
ncbi:cytochrome P450 [Athelia psychrophila]|uniref:Cytochrome P450 n=1 Tax=Athelia psychrophila TaxID=1759441 RepID=A0A165YB93_9AGAM|nr:cytochrome P450 [Fibularhizoctonia sp. CBS 109695]